jgi:hypothetical protein
MLVQVINIIISINYNISLICIIIFNIEIDDKFPGVFFTLFDITDEDAEKRRKELNDYLSSVCQSKALIKKYEYITS